MADSENELEQVAEIDSEITPVDEIDSDIQTASTLSNDMDSVVEVSARYTGLDTDDIITTVDNTNMRISAELTEARKTEIANKVDKIEGKGLSTNDYTTEEKTKLAGLENYDDTELRNLISTKQSIMQFSVMPEASAEYEDKTVQFVGATNSTYTNSYFYRCEKGTDDSYSWVNVKVQDINVKYDTTANWALQTTFVPQKGEIIIYSDYKTIDGKNIAGIKVGDGNGYVVDLPFTTTYEENVINNHINDTSVHIQSGEREFWNNKLNLDIQDDILEFNRL